MTTYKVERSKVLDRKERSKLLRFCKEKAGLDLLNGRETWPKRYMLIDLALYTGLRVSEIADLKIIDLFLNPSDPYIHVRNGKGNKSRDVYIDRELAKHLKLFISLKKKTWNESIDKEAPLFAGQKGKVQKSTLQKSFKRAIEESKLSNHYSIHSARHTFATYLLNDTGNLRYVQKMLGHSSTNMTALYADVLPEQNGWLANMISRD